MKLKTKFIFLGLLSVAGIVFTAYENAITDAKIMRLLQRQQLATQVIQRHMDADMQHDGIRGNVYSALYASQTGNKELLKTSQDEVKAMAGEFVQNVDDNIASDIPGDIKQQLVSIREAVFVYAGVAGDITRTADNFARANAMLPALEEQFGILEEGQGKASDMILAWAGQVQKDAVLAGEESEKIMHMIEAFSVLIACLVPMFASYNVFRPISQMMSAMNRIAAGDASASIPHTQRHDEVGDMAKTVQVFKDNVLKIEAMAIEREAQKQEIEKQKRQAMLQLADSFEQSVKSVVSQVGSSATQMRAGAEGVTQIASDTKSRGALVAEVSKEAAQTSSQVAAAAEELTASIREISAQTQKSNHIAAEASSRAESAKEAIGLLSDKSSRVNEIIEVITGIAEQINLLALNATIESARAGEAGKGFAVVASEVKNLATQVAKATDEITRQIGEMQSATQTSVASVMEILNIINQVSGSTSAVAAAVEEQSAVTNEIAQNISRTASGTQEITRQMASVLDGANLTGDTANEVLDSARHLGEQSVILKQKIDEFLVTVRAA